MATTLTNISLEDIARSAASSLGYTFIKPEQEQAISSFMEGNDVFVSLLTGYGKSLCFAALPCAFDKLRRSGTPPIVIVVSPLSINEGSSGCVPCQGCEGPGARLVWRGQPRMRQAARFPARVRSICRSCLV